jgi:WD40 repeat protein
MRSGILAVLFPHICPLLYCRRLYNWRAICSKWLSQRAQQQHDLSWRPHEGSVYAIALTHYDNTHWVVTAGADGHVRLWSLSDILAAAAAAAGAAGAAAGPQVVLKATAGVLLPHLQNPVGVSDGRQPSAQVLSVDVQHQQVFVGERALKGWRGGGGPCVFLCEGCFFCRS